MGLQNNLTDVSSESIPILVVAVVANCVGYLRSLIFAILHALGMSRFDYSEEFVSVGHLFDGVGSGLAGLIALSEELNMNRISSYKYKEEEGLAAGSGDCVVCLNPLVDGDHVSRLAACRHVFHKECFDGWLDHLNFNCPLCRTPLVSDKRVSLTDRRITGDVMAWFSLG